MLEMMTIKSDARTFRVLLSLFTCFPFLSIVSAAPSRSSEFLYKGVTDALHVYDYEIPGTENTENVPSEFFPIPANSSIPSFLSSPENGDRVVEFYAPWCGHCQAFAPHYMRLASETFLTHPDIKFYAVSCTKYVDLCKSMGIRGYPQTFILKSNTIERVQLNTQAIIRGETNIAKEFQMTTKDRNEQLLNYNFLVGHNPGKKNKIKLPSVGSQREIFYDISESFFFNLRTGIYTSLSSLDDQQKKAFKDWLNLLTNTLPENWTLWKATSDLITNFDFIAEDEKNLIKVIDKYDNNKREWSSSCTTKNPQSGYTCGLWQLFHAITVGLVEHNSGISDIDMRISTMQAADTIRNFVEEFFGCAECVAHFTSMYDSCWNDWCKLLTDDASTNSDLEWQKAAIWIWDVHNNVNVRLLKEKAEREGTSVSESDEMKAQWPLRSDCSRCWNVDRSYNADAVYEHLKKTYWPKRKNKAIYSVKIPKQMNHTISNATIAFISLWLMTMWYVLRERRKERIGRHKKYDSERAMYANNI